MKNRIISLVIALTLIAGMIPAVVASAEEASAPEIISQNIEYGGYFGLMYAVDASTVKGGKVTVTVYDADMNEVGSYVQTKTEDITTANGNTVTVYAVTTAPVAAKDMADTYYAKATDAEGNESALKRYSVGEYLYERLYANGFANAKEGSKEYNKKVFYENVLAMGASAQTVLVNDKKAEGEALEALVTDYKYVKVTDGTLADGYAAGIFAKGTTVSVKHTATVPEGKALTAWKSASNTYNSASFVLDDHAVIAPVYGSAVLDFEKGGIPASVTTSLTTGTAFCTTEGGKMCLYLKTVKGGADSVAFGLTALSEADYNTTVFEADFKLTHVGPSDTYYENFVLTDANGNIAYKFTFRHGDAGIQINDESDNQQTVIAPKSTWVSLRIEYTYVDENNVTINTYVNNELKYSSTNFVGDIAIKDVCVFKQTTDVGVGSNTFYDNVSFKQIKK